MSIVQKASFLYKLLEGSWEREGEREARAVSEKELGKCYMNVVVIVVIYDDFVFKFCSLRWNERVVVVFALKHKDELKFFSSYFFYMKMEWSISKSESVHIIARRKNPHSFLNSVFMMNNFTEKKILRKWTITIHTN